MCHTNPKTEDGLFVQQRVNHAVGPKTRNQFLRDAVNTTFAADILAHQHDFTVLQHQVGQRPVDQPLHRLRVSHGLLVAPKSSGAGLG